MVWLMSLVACFHVSSQSTVPHVSSSCVSESEISCSLEAVPKPMRRQSAAALMRAPHHECFSSSSVNVVRAASAQPSRGPKPILSICGS